MLPAIAWITRITWGYAQHPSVNLLAIARRVRSVTAQPLGQLGVQLEMHVVGLRDISHYMSWCLFCLISSLIKSTCNTYIQLD